MYELAATFNRQQNPENSDMTFVKQFFILNFILIALWSCGDNKNNRYGKPIKEFSVGQIDYKIYDKSFSTNVSKDGSQLDTSGGYFLQVNLGITNKTNHSIKFDTSMFGLTNSSGRIFSFSNNMNDFFSHFDTSLNAVKIQPNMTKLGFIIFTVPIIADYNLELNNGNWSKEKSTFFIKPLD